LQLRSRHDGLAGQQIELADEVASDNDFFAAMVMGVLVDMLLRRRRLRRLDGLRGLGPGRRVRGRRLLGKRRRGEQAGRSEKKGESVQG
jgi:hypothetical protein